MLNIIIKNKTLINIYKYSVNIFKFLNKYLYLLSILSLLTSFYTTIKQNKLYKILSNTIKLIVILNLVIGTGFILYFTDFSNNPFTLSFFYDIINSYFDYLKNLWNEFTNFSIEESFIKNVNSSGIDIKTEIKEGVKQGVKEAFDEILTEVSEKNNSDNTYLFKQLALASSVIFFTYFLFILPGSSISPEDLTQYNWMNQSLIELK
jgi:hypothetical protein